jgi:hypothetical protein
LDAAPRSFMESRFGATFSGVRVHADGPAAESARGLNALAYTVGNNIVFGAGQYTPGTANGNRLLAHELTHVLQQTGSVQQNDSSNRRLTPTSDPAELEARSASQAVAEGQFVPFYATQRLTPASLSRQPDDASLGSASTGIGGDGAAMPTVTMDAFRASGSTDPANCCALCPAPLGVGQGGTASNGMEMRFAVAGHRSGISYDILRTRATALWQNGAGGSGWTLVDSEPMGTNDDLTNDDECLIPQNGKIFVTDSPGFPDQRVPIPRGPPFQGVGGGVTDPNAMELAYKFTFAEWVIAKDFNLGTDWQAVSTPTYTFWHAIIRLMRDASLNWTLDATRSEIALGSILSDLRNPPS